MMPAAFFFNSFCTMTVDSIESNFRGELLPYLTGGHSQFPCVCHALMFSPSFAGLNLLCRGYKTIAGSGPVSYPSPGSNTGDE